MGFGECFTCKNGFNGKNTVPKILSCGHSLCSKCLLKLLIKSIPECPLCNKLFHKEVFCKYVTNYALIEPIEKTDRKSLENLKKEVNELRSCYRNIPGIGLIPAKKIDQEENKKTIAKLKKGLNEARDTLKTDLYSVQERLDKLLKIESVIELKDYNDRKEYLKGIASEIENGFKVYTCGEVGTEKAFGAISLNQNYLYFHCLSTDWKEGDNHATTVRLQDLCDGFPNFNTSLDSFLTIGSCLIGTDITIRIRMEEAGVTSQFLRLCMNEVGKCYKGAKCVAVYKDSDEHFKRIFAVDNYMMNGTEKKGALDNGMKDWKGKRVKQGETVVWGRRNGSFVIDKVIKDKRYSNIVGRVVFPLDLDKVLCLDGRNFRIIDSGISLPL